MIKYSFALLVFAFSTFATLAQTNISLSAASDGQTFNTCNGFIIDSGGQGGPGYGNNELQTVTICPDTPGEIISAVFNLFSLDNTNTGTAANPNVDQMFVFDGTDATANSLGNYGGNDLQGVVIQATQLNPSGCLTFQFYSNAMGTGQFTASVGCETPCDNPFAAAVIVNGDAPDSLRVCVGEDVTFQDNGSAAAAGFNIVDYSWDFTDGSTGNGTSVTHSFSVPGEYRVQLFVTDDNGCTNPNLVDLQVLVGTHPSYNGFPGDTTLCIGEQVTFVADPIAYQQEWTGFSGVETVDDGCITDDQLGVAQDVELFQTGFASGATISSVADVQSICVEMEHSYMGDLVILVECPNGQTAILHQQGGGGTYLGTPLDDGTPVDCNDPSTQGVPDLYCFTPGATETWVEWTTANGGFGSSLPAGDYAPIDDLSNLTGCPLNGVWTLTLIDNFSADDGTVFGFGLNFDPSLYPDVTTFEPSIGENSDSSYWDPAAQYVNSISPDGNTINIEPTAPGVYTYDFSVTDDFGCTNDSTLTITVETSPQADAGLDTAICGLANAVVQLNGGVGGGGNYGSPCDYILLLEDSFGDSWNGNTIDVTVAGVTTNYTVSNTDNNGASLEVPLNLEHGSNIELTWNATGNWESENQISLLDPTGAVVYSNGLSGAVPNTTTDVVTIDCFNGIVFEWSSAANLDNASLPNPTATLNASEIFTLTAYPTGHPDCASTDDMQVFLEPVPNAGDDNVLTICSNGGMQDLFPLLGPNAEVANAQWYDPTGAAIAMPFDPATMPAGDYNYVVGIGCTDTAVVDVTIVNVSMTSAIINSDCNACNGEVTLTAVNNTDPSQYSLDGGALQASNQFTGLCPGTYQTSVLDAQGCSADLEVIVTEINLPAITNVVPTDVDCNSANNGTVNITADNVQDYTIDGPNGPVTNQTGQFTDLAPGNYTVSVDNGFGCTAADAFVITEPVPLQINTTIDDSVICIGNSIDLFVTGEGGSSAITYNWTVDGIAIGTGENITVTPVNSPTQYCVTITEACGSPTQTECVVVSHPADIVPVLTPDETAGCFPVDVVFANNTNSNEIFSTSIEFGDGQSFTTFDATPIAHSYTYANNFDVDVLITSIYGCEYTTSYQNLITAFAYPEAEFSYNPSPVSMFDTEVQFISESSSDAVSFDWSIPGSDNQTTSLENPLINYPDGEVGEYPVELIVENQNGCTDTINKIVSVISDVLFYAPNTFTPDNDEFNQTWKVSILGVDIYDFNIKIYNRWGQILFESNDANIGWDGTYGGKLVPTGTYIWSLETKDLVNDARYTYQGHVTLLR